MSVFGNISAMIDTQAAARLGGHGGDEAGIIIVSGKEAGEVSYHPHPLPPHELGGTASLWSSIGDEVSLNPQPLPPHELGGTASLWSSIGDEVSLNPQPLPPDPQPDDFSMFSQFDTFPLSEMADTFDMPEPSFQHFM
jgi:hypothetical protein